MKKIEFININRLSNAYICVFIFYLLLTRITTYTFITGDKVNSLFSTIFAALGCIIILFKSINCAQVFKNKFTIVLLAFIIVSIISSIINFNYGYVDNFKMIIWMGIQYLVLFTLSNSKKTEINNLLFKLGFVVIFFMMICSTISIIQYIFNINYQIVLPDYPRYQGFFDGRLYGIFDDPNYASLAAISAMAFSLLYILVGKSKIFILTNSINVFLQITFVLLSNSRTGLICLIICIFLFAYYIANKKYSEKRASIYKSIFIFILIFIIASVGLFSIRKIYSYIPDIVHWDNTISEITDKDNNLDKKTANNIEKSEQNNQNSDSEESAVIPKESLERSDVGADISNNRFDIWKSAIEITKNNRIFGLSPRNLLNFARINYPYSYTAQTGYETHNGYLSIFIGTGYIGTIIMITFIVLCLNNMIKKGIITKQTPIIMCLLMIITSYAFAALTLQDLFFMNTATSAIFWVCLGLLIFQNGKAYEK